MNELSHIDLEAFEKSIRTATNQLKATSRRRVAEGIAEHSFTEAQLAFLECEIQFALATARLLNEGIDRRSIVCGAGAALGHMGVTAIGHSIERSSDLLTWFTRSLGEGLMTSVTVRKEGPYQAGPNRHGIAIVAPTIRGGRA